MSQTEVQTEERTAQPSAVEQENLERLRREKAEFETEAYEWGKEEAKDYSQYAPYVDLKEIVDAGTIPEDWDRIRDTIRENGYDEAQVIRGFLGEIKKVFESI